MIVPRLPFTAALCSSLLACGDAPEDTSPSQAEPAASTGADVASASPSGPAAGTIVADLGGDRRAWTPLYVDRDGSPQSTSTYQTRTIAGVESRSLSLAGHVGTGMSPDGSLRITVSSTEAFEDCPCTFADGTIEYVVDFPDHQRTTDATVTIDRFAGNGDGTFAAEGSFSGTLADAGAGDPLPLAGTFQVRRILRVGAGS